MSNKKECLAHFTDEEAILKAEARFLNRTEIAKMEGEVNRLWFTPGRVSPNTFWNACERTEQSVAERGQKETKKRLNIIDKVLYPCQFL